MITFQTDGVGMPVFDEAKVCGWLGAVAASHGYTVGRLTYCFCGDKEILEANRTFLGHDYYTDVITFDYTRGDRAGGDVLISLDTVGSNAALMRQPYGRELMRVIAHGLLHLCGIDDKGPGEREIMEAAEDAALEMLGDCWKAVR